MVNINLLVKDFGQQRRPARDLLEKVENRVFKMCEWGNHLDCSGWVLKDVVSRRRRVGSTLR